MCWVVTMQNCRPPRPLCPLGESVADRITQLLQRCDQLKRASDMKPTLFDVQGTSGHFSAVAKLATEAHRR